MKSGAELGHDSSSGAGQRQHLPIERGRGFRKMRRNSSSAVRLFLFPYAGAGPAALQEFASELPAWVDPVGVVYPGREDRFSEPYAPSLTALADEIAAQIEAEIDGPFAFFGHSMGAYLAHQVYARLDAIGSAPEALFLSGAGAPGCTPPPPIGDLPAKDFLRQLISLNGFPREAFQSADLITLLLPILRADFQLCEKHVASVNSDRIVSAPVHAFAGLRDPRALAENVALWRLQSGGEFRLHEYDGDHFFIRQYRQSIVDVIRQELSLLAVEAVV